MSAVPQLTFPTYFVWQNNGMAIIREVMPENSASNIFWTNRTRCKQRLCAKLCKDDIDSLKKTQHICRNPDNTGTAHEPHRSHSKKTSKCWEIITDALTFHPFKNECF